MIVIPSQGRGSGQEHWSSTSTRSGKPFAYKKIGGVSRAWARMANREDITGGMGLAGVAEFDKFVNAGGVLITLGAASFLPAEFGSRGPSMPRAPIGAVLCAGPDRRGGDPAARRTRSSTATREDASCRCAGPAVRCCACPPRNRKDGADADSPAANSRAERPDARRRRDAQPSGGRGCAGRAGQRGGSFATNPAYRWQNLGEFNMLANSILHFNDLPR